jgi:hypothetical protein
VTEHCYRCGRRATKWHHPTMRDCELQYLDPDLRFWMCHSCECAEHDLLRPLGLHDESPPPDGVGEVEWRLRRLGVFLARPASARDRLLAARLAPALPQWADALATHRGSCMTSPRNGDEAMQARMPR